jgi:hypothetical protein
LLLDVGNAFFEGMETLRGRAADHYRAQIRFADIRASVAETSDIWVDRGTVCLAIILEIGGRPGREAELQQKKRA